MRMSTSMMYQQNMNGITGNQSLFMKAAEQLSSGKRVINPSDDPLAASRAVGPASVGAAVYYSPDFFGVDEQATYGEVSAAFTPAERWTVSGAVRAWTRVVTLIDATAVGMTVASESAPRVREALERPEGRRRGPTLRPCAQAGAGPGPTPR